MYPLLPKISPLLDTLVQCSGVSLSRSLESQGPLGGLSAYHSISDVSLALLLCDAVGYGSLRMKCVIQCDNSTLDMVARGGIVVCVACFRCMLHSSQILMLYFVSLCVLCGFGGQERYMSLTL